MIRSSAAFILLALAVFCCGCSARQLVDTGTTKLYTKFRTNYSNCNATGIKSKASLYYTSQGRGHRTTISLWGNIDSPLRLDVRAGIGAYVAHIREDSTGITAFYPEQKTAYTHSSPVRGVKMLGLPFPFSLKDLAGLVSGCYQSLIPADYNAVNSVSENGNLQYLFNRGPVSSITLTPEGLLDSMVGRGEIPWRLEPSAYEDDGTGKMLPAKITVFTENGDKAVLRIKSHEFTAGNWPEDSLKLKLPDETEIVPLERISYVRVN